MSLQTWKDEFYPVKPSKKMSKKVAIEHSLRKWNGLLPKNLKKHGLEKAGRFIQEKQDSVADMMIDAESCALCVKYLDTDCLESENECVRCPLFNSLGEQCDGDGSPYFMWLRKDEPKPMIKALKKLLEETK